MVVPWVDRCKRTLAAALVLTLAACGGKSSNASRIVAGTGYTFSAPQRWEVSRTARQVQAAEGHRSAALVAVSRFPLLRAFRSELWPKVVHELDAAAAGIARQQRGEVSKAKDVTIAGERARRYAIDYTLRGTQLVEELAFVLRGKTEYLLLCRYERGGSHDACDSLMSSFTLT
jgi:hypothetical protein